MKKDIQHKTKPSICAGDCPGYDLRGLSTWLRDQRKGKPGWKSKSLFLHPNKPSSK